MESNNQDGKQQQGACLDNGNDTAGNPPLHGEVTPSVEGWFDLFWKTLMPRGEVSLYCCGNFDGPSLSTGFALAAGVAKREDDTPEFPWVHLFMASPAQTSVEAFRLEMTEKLQRFLESRVPAEALDNTVAALVSRLRISVLDAWETETLAERLRQCDPGSAVLVLSASSLYSPSVKPSRAHSPAGPTPFGRKLLLRTKEDTWVPQVAHATEQLLPVAKERELYLALWTGDHLPERPENIQRLEQLPVSLTTARASPVTALTDQALDLARAGRLNEAFNVCDRSDLRPADRALLKAHCCEISGRVPLAYGFIEPFRKELLDRDHASMSVLFARWALCSGRYAEGRELLERALAAPEVNETFFDLALDAVQIARDDALLARVLEGYQRHFPCSQTLRSHKARELFLAGRYPEVFQLLSPGMEKGPNSSDVWFMWLIARHHVNGPLDYDRLLQEVCAHAPSMADSAAEHWFREALKGGVAPEQIIERALTHPWSEGNTSDAVATLLLGAERLFLTPGGIYDERRFELLWNVVDRTINYLSAHPGDDRRRRQFVRLLDPALSGEQLFELVTHFALSAWPWWRGAQPGRRRGVKRMATEHFQTVLDTLLREANPTTVVGMGTVPVDKLPCPPEEALEFFRWLLQNATAALSPGEDETQKLMQVLHFALLFAHTAGEPDDDIHMRQLGAAALTLSGDFRTARDVAETMLVGISPSDTSQRRRTAWLCFADFCQRSHALPEALFALACANRCAPGSETENDLFFESRLWIRLLRDLKLLAPAIHLLSEARVLLDRLGLTEQNRHHLDQLEATILVPLVLHELQHAKGSIQPETQARFLALCELLADANRRARIHDGELQPGMHLLGQLLMMGERMGLKAPEPIQREFNEFLADVGPLYEPLIKASANREPVVSTLQTFAWGLEKLRDPAELGSVIQSYEFLARRELASAVAAGRVSEALYLLEWSMDRSLRSVEESGLKSSSATLGLQKDVFEWVGRSIHGPGGEHTYPELARLGAELGKSIEAARALNHPRQPPAPEECAQIVAGLSHRGATIHVLGLDKLGGLVRVSAEGGVLSMVQEPRSVFDSRALSAWSQRGYPANYASMDTRDPDGLVTVERTLAGLGISAAPSSAAVFISTTELQPIPPNLLLVGGALAGERVAVASAPSLSWLRAAHATPREASGRRGAWIPTSDSPEEQGTLAAMRDDIRENLDNHGLALSCEAVPAKSLAGADLVFIGAHGSIGPDGLFFRVVADERSARFSAHELARHVIGAGVVILAICNGSRVDPSPFSRATVGLGRLLLDHGCRAVIGAPWSLDISVLRRWVPVFLRMFDTGATVLEANHAANQAVAERFNRHPAHALAMNLLGDPFVTR